MRAPSLPGAGGGGERLRDHLKGVTRSRPVLPTLRSSEPVEYFCTGLQRAMKRYQHGWVVDSWMGGLIIGGEVFVLATVSHKLRAEEVNDTA